MVCNRPMRLWVLAVFVLASSVGHADWPMARFDPQRTAATPRPLTLTKPVISWRQYLGGALGAAQMAALDVNQDQSVDVVLISGGKLVAKQPDDTVIWESPPLALYSIEQIDDFDGDGQPEILATGAAAFMGLFSAKTGALLWRVRPGTFGTYIGSVRVADLNHDGHPDVYAADVACGSINGKPVSVAWSFAGGFHPTDDGSQRLWQLPSNRDYHCGANDVVADLDGDGALEVVTFASDKIYIYDGLTGAALAASATQAGYPLGFSLPYGQLFTSLADVDGAGRRSIIGVSNNSYSADINSRLVTVLSFDRSLPDAKRLSVRWKRGVADLVNDSHLYVYQVAVDLDADGKAEVVTTFVEAGVPRVFIFNGATGAQLSSLENAALRGVVSFAPGERPTLLVDTAGKVKGYRFDGALGPTFEPPVFELAPATVTSVRSATLARAASMAFEVLTLPLPGSTGRLGLVLAKGPTWTLWDPQHPNAPVASYGLPDAVVGVAAARQLDVSGAGPGLLLARSDGYLVALDAKLVAVNFAGGGEFALPGIRTGGFYSGTSGAGHVPVAGKLGRSADEPLVVDSLGRLLRLDASHATLVKAPETVWSWPGAYFPTLIDTDHDGTRDLIAAVEGVSFVGRKPDLTETFRVATNAGDWYGAGLPLLLGGTNPLRFALPQYHAGTGQGRVLAFDATGIKWASAPIVVAGSGQGQLAADDLDGDGVDDPYGMLSASLRGYNGVDGGLLGSGSPTYSSMPVTVRGRAGAITNLAAASIYPICGLTTARPFTGFTKTWELPLADQNYAEFASVVQCPTGLVMANAGYASSHLLLGLVETGASLGDLVLAQGALFTSEAAAADAGVLRGNLGNVTAAGAGAPTFLLGSTDGYLYALDPCSSPPSLRWVQNFRAPVGEPILADTDGDGADEVVVEAADGFLYGVDQEQFSAPLEVLDRDDARPQLAGDVDETHAEHLTAQWPPVVNATGYQYAVFTAGGTALTRNPSDPGDPFITVSAQTTTVAHRDALKRDGRYFFAVRALGPTGASGETLSDGTRWAPVAATDAGTSADAGSAVDGGQSNGPGGTIGAGTKCGCTTAPSAWLGSALFVALLNLKRSRVRRQSRRD